MNVNAMTPEELRLAGLDALRRELGPVGMVRFLQQFATSAGDYSRERHQWLDGWTLDALAEAIARQRRSRETS
jgi:hypothetical protein